MLNWRYYGLVVYELFEVICLEIPGSMILSSPGSTVVDIHSLAFIQRDDCLGPVAHDNPWERRPEEHSNGPFLSS